MRILFILLFTAVASVASSTNRFETYSVAFTDPASAEEMVRAIVGDEGTVALDPQGRRLLVITTDERHAQIAEMMKQLNVPPRNVRIDVAFNTSGAANNSEASVTGGGGVVIQGGDVSGTIKITPRLIDETSTQSGQTVQTLLVASGREATLRVGEDVPYLDWLVDYGLQCGALIQRVNWQQVGSSLVVEPTIVGNGPTIRVRLTPQLSGLVDGKPLQTRFAEVATEVYVDDGGTIQIGGLNQNHEFYSRFLVGVSKSGLQEALGISLTPHIIDSASGVSK